MFLFQNSFYSKEIQDGFSYFNYNISLFRYNFLAIGFRDQHELYSIEIANRLVSYISIKCIANLSHWTKTGKWLFWIKIPCTEYQLIHASLRCVSDSKMQPIWSETYSIVLNVGAGYGVCKQVLIIAVLMIMIRHGILIAWEKASACSAKTKLLDWVGISVFCWLINRHTANPFQFIMLSFLFSGIYIWYRFAWHKRCLLIHISNLYLMWRNTCLLLYHYLWLMLMEFLVHCVCV